MYFFNDRLFVVSNACLYAITEAGAVSTIGTSLLVQQTRPTWAEVGSSLFAANGDKIVKASTSSASQLTDPQIPDDVSHVAHMDSYLLANEGGTGRFHRATVLQPTSWPGGWATAERQPDPLLALHAGWGELVLFGSKTIEHWYNDGSSPFSRLPGTDVEYGLAAKHAIAKANDSFYFLTHERRLVQLVERSPKVVSAPVDSVIQGLSDVSDALLDHVHVGGLTLLVLSFPSAGRTLVYDYAKNKWISEWSYWNQTTASYERWRGNCVCFVSDWNRHFVGDRANGKVYYMDPDIYSDAGDTMRTMWRTPHVDHGTGGFKRSHALRLKVRRGYGSSSTANPVLMIRWRDNGKSNWRNESRVEFDLGNAGEEEAFVILRRLGRYRSRQYEISCTDDIPVSLVGAEERVSIV
jgi:hypothetical protein